MSVEETLLSSTIVLVPIYLGIAKYVTSEVTFESAIKANLVGVGIVFILVGILISMGNAVIRLVSNSPDLALGLYSIYFTVALAGLGGVLIIIWEISMTSPYIVVNTPPLLAVVTGISVLADISLVLGYLLAVVSIFVGFLSPILVQRILIDRN